MAKDNDMLLIGGGLVLAYLLFSKKTATPVPGTVVSTTPAPGATTANLLSSGTSLFTNLVKQFAPNSAAASSSPNSSAPVLTAAMSDTIFNTNASNSGQVLTPLLNAGGGGSSIDTGLLDTNTDNINDDVFDSLSMAQLSGVTNYGRYRFYDLD